MAFVPPTLANNTYMSPNGPKAFFVRHIGRTVQVVVNEAIINRDNVAYYSWRSNPFYPAIVLAPSPL